MNRLKSIKNYFKETFPLESNCTVFYAPGRVNLIGGHTDYNGLPVLPFAINRNILLGTVYRDGNENHITSSSSLLINAAI